MKSSVPNTGSFPTRRFPAKPDDVIAILLLLLFLGGLWFCVRPFVAPTAREASRREIVQGHWLRLSAAWSKAQQHLTEFPEDLFGLALAAEAAATQHQHEEAIRLFEKLPRDGGPWEFRREYGLGRRCVVLGRLLKAEQHFRRALQLHPLHLDANEQLGHVLQVEGRVWEAAPHFFVQMMRGRCNVDELLCVATVERFFRRDPHLENSRGDDGHPDRMLALAAARRALFENQTSSAEEALRNVLTVRADSGEALGRIGRLVVERGDLAEFLQWRGSLPDEARDHPEVWFAQGLKAQQVGQIDGSIRCFLEALQREPNHLSANVQLANCMARAGKTEAAKEISRRAEILSEIESNLNLIRDGLDHVVIQKLIGQLAEIGRYWEAAGWAHILTRLNIPQEIPQPELQRWLRAARQHIPRNAVVVSPFTSIKREEFPTPSWPTPGAKSAPVKVSETAPTSWNFTDDAAAAGINFEYFEGSSEETRLQHIFNVMGGGLGAVDYDNDGWPDLYLAQGNDWRSPQPRPQDRDRLYRNVSGQQFEDVTELAALNELNFSHGVTVGDFNQDGFSDVYIGNKGPNSLYRNNGDGTFDDVTAQANVGGNEWSTSSVFADFTGDGLPDLYVLNYTKIPETTQKECRDSSGALKSCTPRELSAEPDKLYVNHGDGSFRDVSEAAGILAPEGRGLGVVVWDFSGDGLLDIFVANDTSANYLFIHQGTDSDGVPHFQEEGVIRGVAFNDEGHATASMGVAAGDANGDGQIDLFITNFFAESNSLFSQKPDGFFNNLTRPMELRDPSFWMLGFGCQFADLDGDGWEDLILTNGHVDQRSSRGDQDRLPPQLFRNQQGRHFAEVASESPGEFFRGKYLGRGLATFDWNRDGRIDFGVSHLHAPFALVTNCTPPAGQLLTIRLIGRHGCLDPTGAKVVVQTDHFKAARFLTAGNGFLVSNERVLSLGIPKSTDQVRLSVQWPSGFQQEWNNVFADQEIILLEGRSNVIVSRLLSGN